VDQDQWVQLVHEELKEHEVSQACKVKEVPQVSKDKTEPLDDQEHQEPKENVEKLDLVESQGLQERLVEKVHED